MLNKNTSIFICPRCNKRVYRQPNTGDLTHECNSGNPTLDNENVVIIGDWIDYSGSGETYPSVLSSLGLGRSNFGMNSFVRGEKDFKRTHRGKRASTHRQRPHIKYFEFK